MWEIEQRAGELVPAGGSLSREAMQTIALATGRPKTPTIEGDRWREDARARAVEHGFGSAQLRALIALHGLERATDTYRADTSVQPLAAVDGDQVRSAPTDGCAANGRSLTASTAARTSGPRSSPEPSSMLRTLADAYRRAGYQVIGAAPTARAARELRDVAGVPAGTLHALALDLDRRQGFARGTVVLLDEAGMASTRVSARVFEHAERAGVKVIAVADAGQLASVGAGGWFAALTRSHPGPELREVIRAPDLCPPDGGLWCVRARREHCHRLRTRQRSAQRESE